MEVISGCEQTERWTNVPGALQRPPAVRFRLEVYGDWAGITSGWRPAIDGTVNLTGENPQHASTFNTLAEAEEAWEACQSEGADQLVIVRVCDDEKCEECWETK